ncbi:MAG: caspase family protein [Magnetospirillum sp.]|nr:MAG: caspase family protein [Magnetospirillum sp.]
MRLGVAILAGTAVLTVGACATEGYTRSVELAVKPAAMSTAPASDLAVAIVVPPSTLALQTVTSAPLPLCQKVTILPAPFGIHFQQTLEDRIGRVFRSVSKAATITEAALNANVIIEASLEEIALETGCGFDTRYFSTASGRLRALAPGGDELWRSPLTRKRVEVSMRRDDESTQSFWGRMVAESVTGLVDEWVNDLRLRPAATIAFNSAVSVTSPLKAPLRPTARGVAPPVTAPRTELPPPSRFAEQPVVTRFPRGPERPDDVVVIIGNADYTRQGRDIPDVKPAHADAAGMLLYATQTLGVREGNVIILKDATGAQMIRVFGSKDDPRGQLFDWVKPGRSRVFVYYSGHGAPGTKAGSPFLVPVDADATRIELNGYPLKTLYDNLGKLPAESVTVVLESCFSGISPAGSLLGGASPVFFEVTPPPVPETLTVITAGAANQMANWEQDGSSGLFTRYFLEGMAGKADANRDGRVSFDELDHYLKETLTYYARRYYGRDQQAQIVKGGGR